MHFEHTFRARHVGPKKKPKHPFRTRLVDPTKNGSKNKTLAQRSNVWPKLKRQPKGTVLARYEQVNQIPVVRYLSVADLASRSIPAARFVAAAGTHHFSVMPYQSHHRTQLDGMHSTVGTHPKDNRHNPTPGGFRAPTSCGATQRVCRARSSLQCRVAV